MTKVASGDVAITRRVMSRTLQTANFLFELQPLWSTRLDTRSDDGDVEAVFDASKSVMISTTSLMRAP